MVLAIASATSVIFTPNSGLAILLVASAANSTVPEMALSQTPAQTNGKNRSSGASGSCRAHPSTRRSITTLRPATIARPAVCAKTKPGYAQSEPLSRTQVQNADCSSADNK